MLMYHHCRSLESVVYGEVKANPKYYDAYFKDAYNWLEKKVGFATLFVAVGCTNEDLRMTGYQDNWRIKVSDSKIRRAGQFPNDVLFSFDDLEGVFMDYDCWHIALNSSHKNYQLSNYEKRLIFKHSWSKTRWLRYARQQSHSVQLVLPMLDLRKAGEVWTRNSTTKKCLEEMGFENVEVRRISV